MKYGQSRGLQLLGISLRVACRRGNEFHPLVDDEIHNTRVTNKGLRDIDAKGFVRQLTHLEYLVTNRVQLPRGRLDNAQAASVRHRRGQLRPSDPAHGRLNNGGFHTEQLSNAVIKFHLASPNSVPCAANQQQDPP